MSLQHMCMRTRAHTHCTHTHSLHRTRATREVLLPREIGHWTERHLSPLAALGARPPGHQRASRLEELETLHPFQVHPRVLPNTHRMTHRPVGSLGETHASVQCAKHKKMNKKIDSNGVYARHKQNDTSSSEIIGRKTCECTMCAKHKK